MSSILHLQFGKQLIFERELNRVSLVNMPQFYSAVSLINLTLCRCHRTTETEYCMPAKLID